MIQIQLKKAFSALLWVLVFTGAAYSEPSTVHSERGAVQILIPKTPYVGDRSELKYVFHSDADLFSDKITGQQTSSLELDCNFEAFANLSDKCLVQKAVLEHTGFEYSLTITFIPWKSGTIDFASFDLERLVRRSQKLDDSGAVFFVDFAPVTIYSIAQATGTTVMRPSKPPMAVPGTTFMLGIIGAISLVFLLPLIIFIIRLPAFLLYYASARDYRRLRKLKKQTDRNLAKLVKDYKNRSDYDFCLELKRLLRNYLCARFDESFKSVTTGSLYSTFEKFALGSLNESQENAVSELYTVFQRCDYICFAGGSLDTKRQPASMYEAILAEGERELMTKRARKAIELFDVEEENAGV
ncbi:MAG TPA: hypothetical protein DCF70_08525 [Treponema sp.]|nr:hypothetical protein [Treponema sp.]